MFEARLKAIVVDELVADVELAEVNSFYRFEKAEGFLKLEFGLYLRILGIS